MNKRVVRTTKREKLKKVSKDVGIFILEMLINIPGSLAHSFLDPKGFYQYIELEGYIVDRFSDRLKDLEKRGFIEINNNSVSITKKGKIRHLEKSKNNSRDGKWRFLSFDIPEVLRIKRNYFRRSIKRIGYKQVQKSLWACPFVKADEVDLIIDEHNVRNYIAYFVVEKTDIEDHLQKLFKTP